MLVVSEFLLAGRGFGLDEVLGWRGFLLVWFDDSGRVVKVVDRDTRIGWAGVRAQCPPGSFRQSLCYQKDFSPEAELTP